MKATILILIGIWLGMLLGISFLEAPLKFRAPDITLPLGLGIGKLVFGALNKVEIVISIALIFMTWFSKANLNSTILLLFGIAALTLFLQTIWLLPALDHRATEIIAGNTVPNSYHHILYILGEILKVVLLVILFFKYFYHE